MRLLDLSRSSSRSKGIWAASLLVPSQTVLSRLIDSTSFCSSALTGLARASGRFISTPCWMSGAVTMKMMSSTSITSTSGVTLISVSVWRPMPPEENAKRCLLAEEVPLDDVQEVVREVGHLAVEHADLRDEEVVGHHRRDGGEEAHRR